jgi:DNA-binding transcriptional ArsR family regulator
MPEDDVTRRQLLTRLATLRRLYHHVINGGSTTPSDEARVGMPATAGNISCMIRQMEQRTA